MEGIAQAMPLFVAPTDEDLLAAVRLDHYLELVRAHLHLAVNDGASVEECVAYARDHVPFWTNEQISNLLTDRTTNPLLRSYLWAYPAGLDWFASLADRRGPIAEVLQAAYREALTPADLDALWPDGPALACRQDLDCIRSL